MVIVLPPHFDLLPGILQAQEPMLVEAFEPEAAVEGLDEGIISGLSRSGEVQLHPFAIGPQVQLLGGELRAVVLSTCIRWGAP